MFHNEKMSLPKQTATIYLCDVNRGNVDEPCEEPHFVKKRVRGALQLRPYIR